MKPPITRLRTFALRCLALVALLTGAHAFAQYDWTWDSTNDLAGYPNTPDVTVPGYSDSVWVNSSGGTTVTVTRRVEFHYNYKKKTQLGTVYGRLQDYGPLPGEAGIIFIWDETMDHGSYAGERILQYQHMIGASEFWQDWIDFSVSVSSVSAPPTITVTFNPSPLSFTYNGSPQGPSPNPSRQEATFDTNGTTSATNVGTYGLQYVATGSFSGDWQNTWVINPAGVTFYLTQSNFTYTGGSQAPGIGVWGDTNGLSYGTSGTTSAVNAGSYSLNAYTTDGNHSGNNTLSWTIDKANQPGVGISPSSSTVTAGQSITFTASGGTTGNYSWGGSSSGGGATKLVSFPSTGTFNVTVQDTGDNNWNASNTAVATITVTSANRAPTVAWADIPTTFYYGGTEYARASGADADSNLTRIVVEYSTNGGAWQAYTDTTFGATSASTSPATAFSVGITPGNYYAFRAQSYDAAGAASGWLYSGNYYPTNRAPTASFSLSSERALGQTITVTVNVGDPDNNYSYANLWVSTPLRGWVTIKADNSTVVSGAASSANTVASAPGTYSRTFAFTPTDGPGTYTFALAAWDSPGLRTDAANQQITVTKGTQAPVTSAGGSVVYGNPFNAVAAGGSGTGSYTFELVAGGTASGGNVTSAGVVTSTSVGTVLFRVCRQFDSNYNTSAWSPTYTVTFTPASVTFTVSPTSFNYDGSAHGPTITPSVSGATFSTSGTASATAVGSYSVTATANGNFTGTSGAVAWNIVQVTYTLTTAASGPGGVTPGGTYNAGNGVTISATSSTGRFVGWSGDASGLTNPLLVTMDRDKSITGLFVAKLTQTIAFNPPTTVRLDSNNTAVVNLTATASSGLPVRFTLLSGSASLVGSTLTITAAGNVTVQADQDGDATYAAAPSVVRSISSVVGARLKQSEQPDELSDKNKTGSNMVRDRP